MLHFNPLYLLVEKKKTPPPIIKMTSTFRQNTPAPCPRDKLTKPPRSTKSHHHLARHSSSISDTLSRLLPRKGASISQLTSGSMAASSPSLLGQYWKCTAAGKQTHNSGCVDWTGNGTWTRAERGNWCFTGDPESPAPGSGWTDDLVAERERKGRQRGTSTTFGILGHQEDSQVDRLEKQHRAQPGPADNVKDALSEAVQASILNTKLRTLKTLHQIYKKIKDGSSTRVWESGYMEKYGKAITSKKYQKLKREITNLQRQTASMKKERTMDKRTIARIKSQSTTARFVLMEQVLRLKRAEPGPSDYQDHVTKRDFGVDGFTQKISNVPRNCPGYNYKQIKMTADGAAVLLQKDNSYLDVGPGQYAPTRGPALYASKHAPPQIPLLNPRSRASGAKLFTNSQLLPSAKRRLNSTKILNMRKTRNEKQMMITMSPTGDMNNTNISLAAQPTENQEEQDSIWWKTAPGLTIRKRPYGNYKGGDQKFLNNQRIQPAFISKSKHVGNRGSGGVSWHEDVNADCPVEEFLISVPYPQQKQLDGPKYLPMSMHTKKWTKEKHKANFAKEQEDEKESVRCLE